MVTLTHFLEGNPLPPHRLLFSISSKGSFYMHFSIDRTVHTTAFDKPVVDHWLERKIANISSSSLLFCYKTYQHNTIYIYIYS